MREEDTQTESLVELGPSRMEMNYYIDLARGTGQHFVLVACVHEGKDRFAIARVLSTKDKCNVEPLALLLNEADVVLLRGKDGELLPTEHAKSNIN